MAFLVLIIFVLTYLGVAFGRVRGLLLVRTGIALIGAIAMIVTGAVSLEAAVDSVDMPTILLLYALMVISAQLRLGGFYTRIVLQMAPLTDRPRLFLLIVMLTSAILSAVLANDIICLAFTPVLAVVLLNSRLNPLPFLLGLAISSNIGSAATIIGNPQNMLIGQVGRLHFGEFLLWCGPPSFVALATSYLYLCWLYRGKLVVSAGRSIPQKGDAWPAFNRWQSSKGLFVTLALVVLFFTPIPREISALAAAGLLLCSRQMRSKHILGLVDWHLITLFCALFVVIHSIELYQVPSKIIAILSDAGIHLSDLLTLTGVSVILSNLVSNVPATMLLIQFLDPSNPAEWYTLAVSSTFAGNLIIIGSIANLIVIEQAKAFDIEISFKDHARVGVPVTLLSLLALIGWIYF